MFQKNLKLKTFPRRFSSRFERAILARRAGLTLLEMMVVLLILIATALIIVPSFSNMEVVTPAGKTESPVEIATQATLNTVRNAMAGEDGVI
ncbi:MAG: type II secretion system protein, partial [Mariniblastus sp.]|nr:type II secretion system protein [Mariniblastus sp.]